MGRELATGGTDNAHYFHVTIHKENAMKNRESKSDDWMNEPSRWDIRPIAGTRRRGRRNSMMAIKRLRRAILLMRPEPSVTGPLRTAVFRYNRLPTSIHSPT